MSDVTQRPLNFMKAYVGLACDPCMALSGSKNEAWSRQEVAVMPCFSDFRYANLESFASGRWLGEFIWTFSKRRSSGQVLTLTIMSLAQTMREPPWISVVPVSTSRRCCWMIPCSVHLQFNFELMAEMLCLAIWSWVRATVEICRGSWARWRYLRWQWCCSTSCFGSCSRRVYSTFADCVFLRYFVCLYLFDPLRFDYKFAQLIAF